MEFLVFAIIPDGSHPCKSDRTGVNFQVTGIKLTNEALQNVASMRPTANSLTPPPKKKEVKIPVDFDFVARLKFEPNDACLSHK